MSADLGDLGAAPAPTPAPAATDAQGGPLKVLTFPDREALGRAAARELARRLLVQPELSLALPTGRTPQALYRELRRLGAEGLVSFREARVFQLDELLGLAPEHPGRFFRFLREHLLDHVDVRPERVYELPSDPDDPEGACRAYEAQLEAVGGLDLAILGIGENGHIAFNEPGTPFHARTHVATLTPETREATRETFGFAARREEPPERALTLGPKTLMRAREIWLLAAGGAKAGIVARALQGPITPEVPASVLQLHPRLRVWLDGPAAAGLHGSGGGRGR